MATDRRQRLFGKLVVGIALAAVFPGAISSALALQPNFDGVTIIALDDEDGENVIRGKQDSPIDTGKYLAVFVAKRGTYAAMLGMSVGCVAWAVPDSYTGTSITFGLPASKITLRTARPQICQPFTLTYVDAGKVRLDADNPFDRSGGALSRDAKVMHYSREHNVVAHTSLIDLDWGAPVFDRFRIKDIGLGPLMLSEKALTRATKTSTSNFRPQPAPHKAFEALFPEKDAAGRVWVTVRGYLATKEQMQWPWDVLYALYYSEDMPETVTDNFVQAVVERYGPPSLQLPIKGATEVQMFWLVDLNGKQLGQNDGGTGNCLAPDLADHWLRPFDMGTFNGDIGPWGCSLILKVQHNGKKGTVSRYRIEAGSGYVMALNHFFGRLKEMEALREKMAKAEGAKPKL